MRLIDAELLQKYLEVKLEDAADIDGDWTEREAVLYMLELLNSIPEHKARWAETHMECSNCGTWFNTVGEVEDGVEIVDYCPCCGAHMELTIPEE